MAFEGIEGAASIVNAPTGCKFAPSYTASQQDPRNDGVDPAEYEQEFFFGQSRIPCTYLDESDYVQGSGVKLARLLRQLEEKGSRLIGIVNGPGTSLIGDDLGGIVAASGVRVPVVGVEAAGITGSASVGFTQAMSGVLEKAIAAAPVTEPGPEPIAICGISLLSLRWKDDLAQLREELALAGLGDVVSVGAGATLEDLARAQSARVIVAAHESYGAELTGALRRARGAAVLPRTLLAPVGLQASEHWLLAVAEAAGADPQPIRKRAEQVRGALYRAVSRFHTRTGLPGGLTCLVAADAAIAAPLVLFLADHLGMFPGAVLVRERAPEAERFLSALAREHALPLEIVRDGSPLDEAALIERLQPDMVFGSSHDAAIACETLGRSVPFVPVAYPESGRIRLTPRPLMGLRGSLVLCEDLLNAIVPLSRTAVP
jgi:nitrogenase molybdenum-iron protein alpha/beta subunit